MREPAFWWHKPGLCAGLLTPIAVCYGAIAARRMTRTGQRAGLPVVCVGNFTLGGAGKTPAAIAIARMLGETGERVFCLSRGPARRRSLGESTRRQRRSDG
jgi:tetraacyldisaccharide 4'-kinase